MNILVSACLLGVNCRYNGGGVLQEDLLKLKEKHLLIPVCPEQLGGLPTPRTASEIRGNRVVTKDSSEVTKHFNSGAEETLKLAKLFDCTYAILKERSPSCGFGKIYDGNFTGTLVAGNGITADLLSKHGITILGESQIPDLLQTLENL